MNYGSEFFDAVFRYSPVGLIILNDKTELVESNEAMFESFSIKRHKYKGEQFGNVFGCSLVAGTANKCGTTDECAQCDIRKGLLNVLFDDAKIKAATISHPFLVDNVHALKWFKLSASAIHVDKSRYAVVSFTDISTEKHYEQLLQNELTFDQATGVLNKKNLIGILMDMSHYIGQYSRVSVGIIDMDDFKSINDDFGHLKGDEVLQYFSDTTRSNIRKQDVVGRFGGEEFMFVFPGLDIKSAGKVLKRIHDKLRRQFEPQGLKVSFSAGFTEIPKEKLGCATKEEIIKITDDFLYQAKHSGKAMLVSDHFTMQF